MLIKIIIVVSILKWKVGTGRDWTDCVQSPDICIQDLCSPLLRFSKEIHIVPAREFWLITQPRQHLPAWVASGLVLFVFQYVRTLPANIFKLFFFLLVKPIPNVWNVKLWEELRVTSSDFFFLLWKINSMKKSKIHLLTSVGKRGRQVVTYPTCVFYVPLCFFLIF